MKHNVYVKYPDFVEHFEVDIFKNNVLYELVNVISTFKLSRKPLLAKLRGMVLDLSLEPNKAYSIFPFDNGDLIIIQRDQAVFLGFKGESDIEWTKINVIDLIFFVSKFDKFNYYLDFVREDRVIFLNSLLNDFYRNDYSASFFNKEIKYFKICAISLYISHNLGLKKINRIILDQTLLGDIDIHDIAMSFRFLELDFLSVYKITNDDKITLILNEKGLIDANLLFKSSCFVINRPDARLINFVNFNNKLEYKLDVDENYVFDIGDDAYELIINQELFYKVKGVVYLYNGNDKDLMIQGEEEVL